MCVDRMTVRSLPSSRDERERVAPLVGVEAVGRLVEDEHVGAVQERIGEPDALAIALGELADDAAPLGRERDGGQRLVDARAAVCARGTPLSAAR